MDFDWLGTLWFSRDVLEQFCAAFSHSNAIYTGTTVAFSGINKTPLAKLGGEYRYYISDPRVARTAREQGITRSMTAIDIAAEGEGEKPFVFGSAPTVLFRLFEYGVAVSGVVGVPIGFVGAEKSKDVLIQSNLPVIATLGRKRGSNVVVAATNATFYHTQEVR